MGEVLCVLVNHFAHAADELGPGEPLAGRQLQAEGLEEAEKQRRAPHIAAAVGQDDTPSAACLLPGSTSTLPCKTPRLYCQPKVSIKIQEWSRLGNYGSTLWLLLPDTLKSTFWGFFWVMMPHRGQHLRCGQQVTFYTLSACPAVIFFLISIPLDFPCVDITCVWLRALTSSCPDVLARLPACRQTFSLCWGHSGLHTACERFTLF